MPYVPITWLAEHTVVPAGTTAERLAEDLVRVGLEEEGIAPAPVTGPLVVGRVLSREEETHGNGKTIGYCRVDVGELNDAPGTGAEPADVPSRGIVCGAPNVYAGQLVVVALPGAVLPGDFRISPRTTYGHTSDGMICSAAELGLSDEHDGIIDLSDLLGADAAGALELGSDLTGVLGLGEEILEINVTPDRGYCFSMRGVAREYHHSTGAAFTDPGLPENLPGGAIPAATPGAFGVEIVDENPIHGVPGADRFVTRVVRGIDPARPTPPWLAARLRAAGMRPISLTVDVTNYVMLDLGQPIHAYDLARVAAPIVVRRARSGERLTTLDDVERTLHPEDLLITDSPVGAGEAGASGPSASAPAGDGDAAGETGGRGSRVLGLAGVMGGQSTEVSASTTDVLVEAAHFDQISVARTARRHRLPSEAAKRFERGVDPLLAPVAAQRVVDLLVELGGGTADEVMVGDVGEPALPGAIAFDPAEARRLVGVDYSRERVVELLTAIGCTVGDTSAESAVQGAGGPAESAETAVGADGMTDSVETAVGADGAAGAGRSGTLDVTPPSWRPDLVGPAHLVEEIARLDGYDAIPSILPSSPQGGGLTRAQVRRRDVSRTLAEAGLTEVLTYPFIGDVHDRLGYAPDDERRAVVRLSNPLADDSGALRTSILDTLLEAARRNVSRASGALALLETGVVTRPAGVVAAITPSAAQRPSDAELSALAVAVPAQPRHVAGVLGGVQVPAGPLTPGRSADWADAIELARTAAAVVGVEVRVEAEAIAPFHPGRSARVVGVGVADGEDAVLGHAGELHPDVVAAFGLPARTAAFELDLDLLTAAPTEPVQVRAVSTFPSAKEDFAFVVDSEVPAADVVSAVGAAAGELAEEVRLFDVYAGDQVGEGRVSYAVAVRLRAPDRTLTAEDIAGVRERIVAGVGERFGATLRA
ncbi:phenylalanine--tRNA ligase subunit beta [Georgenia sp. Z1344]|uniref:phenylalanine--tRNA ligase subunit beta n=1 Tax=Georgenia sp. Z1344 TaxID=3416706 RepID=UPI003CF5C7BF